MKYLLVLLSFSVTGCLSMRRTFDNPPNDPTEKAAYLELNYILHVNKRIQDYTYKSGTHNCLHLGYKMQQLTDRAEQDYSSNKTWEEKRVLMWNYRGQQAALRREFSGCDGNVF